MQTLRDEKHSDHGDQHVVEVPCERIPGGHLDAFVSRHHDSGLWHLVNEAESDGQIISEAGKHGSPNVSLGANGKPLSERHIYHVRVHEQNQDSMLAAFAKK